MVSLRDLREDLVQDANKAMTEAVHAYSRPEIKLITFMTTAVRRELNRKCLGYSERPLPADTAAEVREAVALVNGSEGRLSEGDAVRQLVPGDDGNSSRKRAGLLRAMGRRRPLEGLPHGFHCDLDVAPDLEEEAVDAGLAEAEKAVLWLAVVGGGDDEAVLATAERRVLRKLRLPRDRISLRSAVVLLLSRGGTWTAADLYRQVRKLIPAEMAIDCYEREWSGEVSRIEMVRLGRRRLVVRALADLAYRAPKFLREPQVRSSQRDGGVRRWWIEAATF